MIRDGWKEKTENKSQPEVHVRSPHYRQSTQPSPPNCQELQIVMMIRIQEIQDMMMVMKTIDMAELRNVNSFTQSKILELKFTLRKARK